MSARTLMIQGTGSNVGKSLLVAGLCRYFANQDLRVLPFKPQNMSNNAAVTPDGGEIGRAQALQAMACRAALHVDMNPVLLKPQSDIGAQVIVHGQPCGYLRAEEFLEGRARLHKAVFESFERLKTRADLVLVEGAGSPAETNLRAHDIANMGFATVADVAVILVGDIDRGGVIAQIVGTKTVLSARDGSQIAGYLINKFRGDRALFAAGEADITTRTNWPHLGTIPWFERAHLLPAEDAVDLAGGGAGGIRIVVPMLSRIANFDDFDPLKAHPGVSLEMIPPGRALPGNADLVILPGTKSTIADLAFFRAQGWDIDLAGHIRRGGHVLGICGGFQMLGHEISDLAGIEGPPGTAQGLGYLDVTTEISPQKRVVETRGSEIATGLEVCGYEIHAGRTVGAGCESPWLTMNDAPDGAISADQRIIGTYQHGVFGEDGFRHAFLSRLGPVDPFAHRSTVDDLLDALAAHIGAHCDTAALLKLAR